MGRSRSSLYSSAESFLGAIHPEDAALVDEAGERHYAGASTDIEYRIVRPDGAVRWIRDHSYPAKNEDGKTVRVVGIARDVTEYKRTGDKIREQASLLDSARDAIVVRDLEHRVTYWNKSAERMYGLAAEDVLGRAVPEIFYKDPAAFQAAFAHLLKFGEWAGEMDQANKRGEPLTVESRWTLVRDSGGQPKSVLVINTDITERRALEQRFLRAQRLESLGTLAGGIAHDLNNVLTPITIALELLSETERDRHSQELLATATSSAKRGAQMVAQVLSFARGMEGRRELIDARELINDIEKIVHDTFPKSIAIDTSVGHDLWHLVGDSTQLQQVLLNLCVNARDAMPGGGRLAITAENATLVPQDTALHGNAQTGPHVVIQVEDIGHRHSARDSRQDLRSVLHHQGAGQGHWAWDCRLRSPSSRVMAASSTATASSHKERSSASIFLPKPRRRKRPRRRSRLSCRAAMERRFWSSTTRRPSARSRDEPSNASAIA